MGCAASSKSTSDLCGGLSPTITKNLNMDKEAGRLHDAVKGLGTDETCIVRILSKFTNKGRKRLLKAYKDRFNEDFTNVIESELSGVTEQVVSALLCSPVTYDVQSLNKAFQDQDYDTVETIMLSSRSEILVDIEEEYLTEYNKKVQDELLKMPDKDVQDILGSLLNTDRPFINKRADKIAAKERAKQLHKDHDLLSLLYEPLSRNQLRETLDAFQELYRVSLDQFIEDNYRTLSQRAQSILKDCVLHIENPPLYFAKKIKNANETQLLRLLVSRSEIDLYYIKKEYLRWYSTQLHEAIKKQCGRNYANLLTVILELRGQYSESAKKR